MIKYLTAIVELFITLSVPTTPTTPNRQTTTTPFRPPVGKLHQVKTDNLFKLSKSLLQTTKEYTRNKELVKFKNYHRNV